MLESVTIRGLRPVVDERGYLMEILRKDDPDFTVFGQAYITTVNPGVVKAWHKHLFQTDKFCLIKGSLKFGFVFGAESKSVVVTDRNPCLITVPFSIWHGFMNIGTDVAYILNLPDKVYNRKKPDEIRMPWDTFHDIFTWPVQNG